MSQIVVLPKDLAARAALRDQITKVFEKDFPEVRGRVKLPVSYTHLTLPTILLV